MDAMTETNPSGTAAIEEWIDVRRELDDASSLIEKSRALLASIDHALSALNDGTYGKCEVCGDRIDPSALDADVLAARCSAHRSTVSV